MQPLSMRTARLWPPPPILPYLRAVPLQDACGELLVLESPRRCLMFAVYGEGAL
jgi:hypothetical protein